MPVASSSFSTISVVIIFIGVAIALCSFGPLRHSWTRRLKTMHSWFHHPSELEPPKTETETTSVASTSAFGQEPPPGWNWGIYRDRTPSDSKEPSN